MGRRGPLLGMPGRRGGSAGWEGMGWDWARALEAITSAAAGETRRKVRRERGMVGSWGFEREMAEGAQADREMMVRGGEYAALRMDHERWMRLAIERARAGIAAGQ